MAWLPPTWGPARVLVLSVGLAGPARASAPSPAPVPSSAVPPAASPAVPDLRRSPPPGFVRLSEALPGVVLAPRYGTADNFTGAPLPGYGAPQLWARSEAAAALAQVRELLAQDGLDIIIYDAYRPRRASAAMVAWTRRTGQTALLDQGYIAARSGHNHGHTVDLSLVRRDTGAPVDMGGAWDAFAPVSHADADVDPVARGHRATLRQAMRAAGFQPYSKEWWHFRLPMAPGPALDLPYGCHEPATFVAPEGWAEPDWTPPAAPAPTGCR